MEPCNCTRNTSSTRSRLRTANHPLRSGVSRSAYDATGAKGAGKPAPRQPLMCCSSPFCCYSGLVSTRIPLSQNFIYIYLFRPLERHDKICLPCYTPRKLLIHALQPLVWPFLTQQSPTLNGDTRSTHHGVSPGTRPSSCSSGHPTPKQS